MTEEDLPLEKRLAMLAACALLLSLKSRVPRAEAPSRQTRFSGWTVAARLDAPSEDWRTLEWGKHEEEV